MSPTRVDVMGNYLKPLTYEVADQRLADTSRPDDADSTNGTWRGRRILMLHDIVDPISLRMAIIGVAQE